MGWREGMSREPLPEYFALFILLAAITAGCVTWFALSCYEHIMDRDKDAK